MPSIATAASAAITRISATTQPQLRLRPGGLGASPRGGIICGATDLFDEIGSVGVEMISVAGSGGVSIIFVVDESIPDGAVYRRSAGSSCGGSASTVPVSSIAITSVGCSSTMGGASSVTTGAALGSASASSSVVDSSSAGSSADSAPVRFPGRALMGSTSLLQSSRYASVCRLGRRSLLELNCPTAQ